MSTQNLRMPQPTKAKKCKATTKHGANAGKPCGRYPIPGGTVCVKHGGKAPQVRRKAEEQLRLARDELMEMLLGIARDATHSASDRLKAITWALERAGFKGGMAVDVTVNPGWQEVLAGLFADQSEVEQQPRQKAIRAEAQVGSPVVNVNADSTLPQRYR